MKKIDYVKVGTTKSNPEFKSSFTQKHFVKIGLNGSVGSGKTVAALALAKGLGKRVKIIDAGGGAKDQVKSDSAWGVTVPPFFDIEHCTDYIRTTGMQCDVLVFDDISVPWKILINEMDLLALRKFKGDSRQAWREGSQRVRYFIQAIHDSPCHFIATMRAETQWIVAPPLENGGAIRCIRVGLKPEQTRDIEYEFDLFLQLQADFSVQIVKDTTGILRNEPTFRLTPELGKKLAETLSPAPSYPNWRNFVIRCGSDAIRGKFLGSIAYETRLKMAEKVIAHSNSRPEVIALRKALDAMRLEKIHPEGEVAA